MNVLIILGHPNSNSFNHSIADTCKTQIEANGHSVFFHDLYAENFDPIHHVENINSEIHDEKYSHCFHLTICDAIIVIHPNWWGQPPAIIKGWMDRVLLPGIAYNFEINDKGEHVPVGLLKAKFGLILNTSNTPNDYDNDPLDVIWNDKVLSICGVNEVKRINLGMIKKSDDTQRAQWLLELKQVINSFFSTNK